MDKKDIILTVARYFVANSKDLRGALVGERYFNLAGVSNGESSHDDYKVYRGFAIDILAKAIEDHKFFGDYVPEEAVQADNRNNADLLPLRKTKGGILVRAKDFEEIQGGLLVKFPIVGQKDYMNVLRTAKDFLVYAGMVDLNNYWNKNTPKNVPKCIERLF